MSLLDKNAFPEPGSVTRERIHPYVIRTEKRQAIDAEGDGNAPPLSVEERNAKLAQLEKSLTRLFRDEEAVIMKIEEHGAVIPRLTRDPLILLGVELAP